MHNIHLRHPRLLAHAIRHLAAEPGTLATPGTASTYPVPA